MDKPIYLDYNATTPVAPEVAEAIQPFLFGDFGNPSSSHAYGRAAADALATARHQVAQLIGAEDDEIIFTAHATEANNLAILGAAAAISEAQSRRRRLAVSGIEHPAVMEPALHLKKKGWSLHIVPVDSAGQVLMSSLAEALREDLALVSVMHANNEIGTLQRISEIAAQARQHGAIVHTDAAQSVGKVDVDVRSLGVDLLTIAGHKLYAPKGVGALYIRRGTPIESISFGAGQERGLRPGTENVALAVGLGVAAELASKTLAVSAKQMRRHRDLLHERLSALVPGLRMNGHALERLPNTLSVSFPAIDGAALLAATPEVAASTGSACHADQQEVSGVLAAMGRTFEEARGTLRLSVGRETTDHEVEVAAQALARAWNILSGP